MRNSVVWGVRGNFSGGNREYMEWGNLGMQLVEKDLGILTLQSACPLTLSRSRLLPQSPHLL